jgi:hypothetical protein
MTKGLPYSNTLCVKFLTGRCNGPSKCSRPHDVIDKVTLYTILRNTLNNFQPTLFHPPPFASSALVPRGQSEEQGGSHA